jgi:hypothetical protein
MGQYQVQDNASKRLFELLDKLRFRNRQGYGSGRVTQPSQYTGEPRSSGLDSLRNYFSDWSMQNAKTNPYEGVSLPSMPDMGSLSLGSGQRPTIYGNNAVPVQQPQAMPEPMPYSEAKPDLTALVQELKQRSYPSQQAQRQAPPAYDYNAVEQFTQPSFTEGQNANIQDDTRTRAMQWLAQQQGNQ